MGIFEIVSDVEKQQYSRILQDGFGVPLKSVLRGGGGGRGQLVGWLFWVKRPFETIFQAISGEREERIDESKKCPNNPHPHLLQAQ